MANTPEFYFVHNLATALLDGAWTRRAMRARARQACPCDSRWLAMLVREVSEHFSERSPDVETLVPFLQNRVVLPKVLPAIQRYFLLPAKMTPRWPVPMLATSAQIAAWLDVPIGRLDWLADVKGLTIKQADAKLRHYVNVWIPRRCGKSRLLEAPKPQLKTIQRRILDEILDRIPPHDAAHGFRAKRSIVSYVQPHVGRRIVLHFDLRDFFASVSAARVQAIFRTAGYPREVARLLTGLCTTRTPDDVKTIEPRWRLRHLPQGAPTSPALANLAAYRLDLRLLALAQTLGANYTRYADDLAFSGGQRLERAAKRIQVLVAVIAAEEGFEMHFRKSRFMRQAVRQQLAGVVVNVRPNLRREVYDELKAILHNCVRHGPAAQNRAGHADFRRHLRGRVAHVKMLHPSRGAKLQALFERIVWPT
jgi:RNA-directed DNA polymerase